MKQRGKRGQIKQAEAVVWDLKNCEVKWNEVAQSCLTLCDPVDCSLPGSSIHGIFQAWVLEWVAIYFSRESFQLRDWTQVPTMQADALPSEPPGK